MKENKPMRRAPHSPLQPVQVMRQKRNLSNLQQLVLPMKKRMVTRQPHPSRQLVEHLSRQLVKHLSRQLVDRQRTPKMQN